MIPKFIEILDRHTFVPAVAFAICGTDSWLARRAGFGERCVYLIAISTQHCAYDPYSWGSRTMQVAHSYLEAHWDELLDGALIDVEFILGETRTQKVSEQPELSS